VTDRSSTRGRSTDELPDIDTTVAHAARVYDYMLGGTTNFEADRAASHAAAALVPGGHEGVTAGLLANRGFLARAVHHLAADEGIRQFLDIGAGIPANDNVHEVAQQVAPESRVVYVDYDPIVLAHSHALLRSSPQGVTSYIQDDLRHPEDVLEQAAKTLDLTQPVAVLLVAILHFFPDEDDPGAVVERLLQALPSGSYLVVSHLARDIYDLDATYARLNEATQETFVLRTHDEVSRFFAGVEVIDPGVVLVDRWRPAPDGTVFDGLMLPVYGGVGRKP
jgi:hypothetical protein